MTDTKPELLTDEETGREYYRHENGMEQWKDTGHFKAPPTITPILADPKGMVQRRNEKSRQVAREAIDEGAGIEPHKWGTGEGWRKIIAHTVRVYLESKNIRGMAETLTKLGMVSGYATKDEDTDGKGGTIHATPQAILELLRELEAEGERRKRTIDV
jgi:hypothetical protein